MTYKLPEPAWWTGSGDFTDDPHVADGWQLELDAGARSSLDALFTADQVLQARNEALEEAARKCEEMAEGPHGDWKHASLGDVASAIRALKEKT